MTNLDNMVFAINDTEQNAPFILIYFDEELTPETFFYLFFIGVNCFSTTVILKHRVDAAYYNY